MKKIFLLIAAAVSIFAASCSKVEDFSAVKNGEEVTVSFSAALPEIATRAYSDGTTATTLTWAVYPENEKTVLLTGTKSINISTTVEMKLVAGKTYDVLFWAADANNKAYALDLENQKMTVNYEELAANNESNDAFFAFKKRLQVKGAVNEQIDLKRPFAQINLGTNDYKEAKAANLLVGKTSMEAKLANVLNLSDGSVSGAEVVRAIPAGVAPCAGDTPVVDIENPKNDKEIFPVAGYQYLQMNYILVGAEKSIVDCTFYVYDATTNNAMDPAISVASVPVQRNYRTNIYGALLTKQAVFNVIIQPDYTDDFEVPASVGTLIAAGQNGGNVALTEDVQLDQTLVVADAKTLNLDLNGKKITAPAETVTKAAEDVVTAIRVFGELVVDGEGTVDGGAGNAGNYAIIVEEGGKLTINGGTYTTGLDKDGLGNATIENKGGEIIINDGHFSTAGAYNGVYFVLNKKDNTPGSITVYGGSFVNYDPSNSSTENPADNFVAEGYEAVLDEATSTYVVGLKKEGATAKVMTAAALKEALMTFTSVGADSNTIYLEEDITLAEGETWEPIYVNGYGAVSGILTIDGQGHTISGLDNALFDGGFAGSAGIAIKNLTIADSEMLTTPSQNSMDANGIFLGGWDATGNVILKNCHAVRCNVAGIERAGLIGYSSAEITKFDNCSVTDCDFSAEGVGGLAGHVQVGTADIILASKCQIVNCRFNNTASRSDKTGCVFGTINGGNFCTLSEIKWENNTFTLNGVNGGSLSTPLGRLFQTISFNGENMEPFNN